MSNNEGFQTLNSRTRRTRKNINTQLNVLNCLSDDMLNGLLQRFRNQQVIKDINILRQTDHELNQQLVLNSSVVTNSKNYKASVYINYILNGTNVFHFSFHLCPTNSSHRNSGLIHVKQGLPGQEKIRSIRVVRSNSNSFLFKLGKQVTSTNIDQGFIKETAIICKVLNMYFDTTNPVFIGVINKRTNRSFKNVKRNKNASLNALVLDKHKTIK